MKKFEMCPDCTAEYKNPLDRRFHAQPNACPICGPRLELWDEKGNVLGENHDALLLAAETIRSGKIAAVKGLGGFHLLVNAQNADPVNRLRERKHREEKPLAIMFPSLESVKIECEVNEFETRLLLSPESPIVLLKRIQKSEVRSQNETTLEQSNFHLPPSISASVAPNNPYLGVMLPYTPLHHILLKELGFPVVATSGNLSDEPICIDEHEALHRLHGIADVFLVHDRPIVRHMDDSIVRVMMDRELILRRARGYAPLPISVVGIQHAESLLAVGAHLKNTIALTSGINVFISQHIGDLETEESLDAFHRVIADFQALYETKPAHIVCDLHPDYLSSKFARSTGIPLIEVQHHYAHIASCMAENQLEGELLGVSWDGTGYGLDKTIWGGEFLLTTETSFERIATFRSFRLLGGEKAIKEPRRIALGMLYEIYGNNVFDRYDLFPLQTFTRVELDVLKQMFMKNINVPRTTSAGRIFDAVASLIGLRQSVNYEGQAAMELEFLSAGIDTNASYSFSLEERKQETDNNQHFIIIIDWSSLINEILADVHQSLQPPMIAAKFHNTLVEIIVAVAKKSQQHRVVLSGGCFQNKYLTEHTVNRLREEGFRPYWRQRVPPNDGGIALGQIYAALRLKKIEM